MAFYRMRDGEKLFVREFGQGEPVLVLSGLGMQSWQWFPFFAPLLKQYKFIIPDWRGFGGSKHCKIPNEDAISSHWLDIESLISQLNEEKLIVIAYSMGATTAMHGLKYGQFKDHIKAYLHIDQTPKIASDDNWQFGLLGDKHLEFKKVLNLLSDFLHENEVFHTVTKLPNTQRKTLVALWMQFLNLQSKSSLTTSILKLSLNRPHLQKHLLPIQRLDYMSWYIDNYLYHTEDYREAIAALNCPTTFFIGEKSSLYPSEGQIKISQSLENAKNVVFKRSGHAPLITEPVKFGRELAKFLNNVSN